MVLINNFEVKKIYNCVIHLLFIWKWLYAEEKPEEEEEEEEAPEPDTGIQKKNSLNYTFLCKNLMLISYKAARSKGFESGLWLTGCDPEEKPEFESKKKILIWPINGLRSDQNTHTTSNIKNYLLVREYLFLYLIQIKVTLRVLDPTLKKNNWIQIQLW